MFIMQDDLQDLNFKIANKLENIVNQKKELDV